MEVTVNSVEYRAVKQFLLGGRKATGLNALPQEKRQAAMAANAKLRARLQAGRKQRVA